MTEDLKAETKATLTKAYAQYQLMLNGLRNQEEEIAAQKQGILEAINNVKAVFYQQGWEFPK